ncbi:unnamed protein product, partial [Mesorhabditis belari]|uniref:Uncharacterized protein n=1 Tax=Mesorhabditis belari TaxID=2138241 RepID=A0AAF3J676_9BILA
MTYPDTLLSDDLSTDRLFPPSNIHHQQRELGKQATDSRSTSRRSRSSTSRRSSAKRTETTWPRIFNASEMSSATTSGHSDAQLWARGNHSCFDLMDGYPDYKQNYAKKSLKKNRQVNQSDFEGSKDAIIDGYVHRLGDDALFPPARVVSDTNQRGGKCLVMSLTELRSSDSSQSYGQP